jgi:hypothetical protein
VKGFKRKPGKPLVSDHIHVSAHSTRPTLGLLLTRRHHFESDAAIASFTALHLNLSIIDELKIAAQKYHNNNGARNHNGHYAYLEWSVRFLSLQDIGSDVRAFKSSHTQRPEESIRSEQGASCNINHHTN